MNTKKKQGIFALIGLILILFLITPYLIGQYAKNQITQIINQTSSPFTIRAQILKYHLGWLHSDIKLQIHLENYTQTDLLGDVRIYHGPILCLNDKYHQRVWHIGPFAAAGNFQLIDKELNAVLQNKQNPTVYLVIRQNFQGDDFIGFHTPPLVTHSDNTVMSIGSVDLRIMHSLNDQHTSINALFNDLHIDSQAAMLRLDLPYSTLKMNLTHHADHSWTANSQLYIPQASFYNHLGSAELRNITLSNQADSQDQRDLFSLNLHLEQISMNQQIDGPLDMQIYLRNFFDKDFTHFIDAQKFICEMDLPTDLRIQALDPFFTQLLQSVTAHVNGATLKLADGSHIALTANFAFPQVNANLRPLPPLTSLFGQSFLDLKLTVPTNGLKLTSPKANLLQATLLGFFQQGWLIKENDAFSLRLQHSPTGFLMNGKTWLFAQDKNRRALS